MSENDEQEVTRKTGLVYAAAFAIVGAVVVCLFIGWVLWIYTLGMWKAYLRLRAVALPLASARASLNRSLLPHLFLWPLTAVLYLYNAVAAGFSRRITWRGITYQLKSSNETVVVSGTARDNSSGPDVELNSRGRAA